MEKVVEGYTCHSSLTEFDQRNLTEKLDHRNLNEISKDNEKTWTTEYDLEYRRKKM